MNATLRRAPLQIASLCFGLGLLLTAVSVVVHQRSLAEFRSTRFEEFAAKASVQIDERVHSYERGLRGVRSALLTAGPTRMTLAQFQLVSQSRDPIREFPGSRGFGFIQRVKVADEARFLADAARQGRPGFRIRQLTPHGDERFVVKYIEPEAINQVALGLDVGSEANRRTAMISAMHTGQATLTRPITLVQANGKVGQGFLLLLPVYPAYPLPHEGPERVAAAVGATFSPLLIDEVLRNIDPFSEGVSLTLTDEDENEGNRRFFGPDLPPPTADDLTVTHRLTVFGRQWLAEFRAQPRYLAGIAADYSLAIASVGVVLSLLLASLIYREMLSRQLQRQTSERLQLLIQNAPTALAMFDRDMRYMAVSQRWLDDFSLNDRKVIGKSHYDIYPFLPDTWKTIHQRALQGEEISKDNDRFDRRNGTSRWLHWAIRPWYEPEGDIGGVVIFTEDVTERHLMIGALEQAKDAAEAANRAKTLFLGNMSHEMRTPLHQLNGILTLFYREELSDRQRKRLDMMKSAIQRLDTVIGGILTLVSLEAKTTSVEIGPLDIREVVGSVVDFMADDAGKKKLPIETRIDPLPPSLQGDARHLRTILVSYLSNAIKFSTHGTITVHASCEREDAHSAVIRIAVTDQGIGISADKLGKLFECFEQADSSVTRQYGGTGIGLAIVRKLAMLMGGDAGCDSVLGEGSTFWATVTLVKSAALPASSDMTGDFDI